MDIQLKYQPITFSNGLWKNSSHIPPEEESVTLTVNGNTWLSFRCTPSLLEEMAVGFLFNEHIINSISEVEIIRLCENKKNVDIWLNHSAKRPEKWERTSGCMGGNTSLSNINEIVVMDKIQVEPQLIVDLYKLLISNQEIYKETRGIHCSLLSNGDTHHLVAEDIGRHNTLDKLAGLYLMDQKLWDQKIILTTGRISSEMIQKSARQGAGIIVSRTSPTKASVEYAVNHNITLIGYTRRNEFTVYSHPERIII